MSIEQTQFDKALKSFREASLSVSAKEEMKQAIMQGVTHESSTVSPYQPLLGLGKKAIAGAAVAFVGFGGVAFASMNSVPNDFLYVVKTDIVEPLVGLTKVSTEAQQSYQITLAQERLEELQILNASGDLDAQTRAELQEDFQNHIELAVSFEIDQEEQAALEGVVKVFDSLVIQEAATDIEVREETELEQTEVVDGEGEAGGALDVRLEPTVEVFENIVDQGTAPETIPLQKDVIDIEEDTNVSDMLREDIEAPGEAEPAEEKGLIIDTEVDATVGL